MKLLKWSLLTILCLFIFISCGTTDEDVIKDTASQNTGTGPAETTTGRINPDLPAMNFNGKEYRVLGRVNKTYSQFTNFEIYAESMNGEIINDAVYERNSVIEEKYNVVITNDVFENPEDILKKSVSSGEDVYDLAFIYIQNVGPLAQTGNFYDLNSLKYLDFNKPWWNIEINKEISIEKRLYFATGDYNMMDKHRTIIMLYNKNLAETFNFGNLYDLVYDGTWTVDKMTQFCTAVSDDIDGDGAMTDADRWGLGMGGYGAFYTCWVGAGNFIITKDKDDVPVMSINNERTVLSVDKILPLTNNKSIAFYCNDFMGKVSYDVWYAATNMFMDARLMFVACNTHTLREASASAEFEYGVLPHPKLDEKQENHVSIADGMGAMLTIPITVQDTDFAAFMLEALCAASRYEVLPKYYEVSAKTKYTYDEESPKMLDLIFSTLHYDLGYLYNWGNVLNILANTIPTEGTNTFVSKYVALHEKALAEMEKTLEDFRTLP
ncbi:MAG: hypothetical protein FWF15_03435 [Oscillospiraceae bacterium]|nr:hypothetical protein [Oscillospiraceae bacterium]